MLIRTVGLALALMTLPVVAASEPTYPRASRVGLEAPKTMAVSKRFTGFERPAGGATINVVELPPQAAEELRTMTTEAFRAQGFQVKAREEVKLESGADAVLFSGEQMVAPGPAIRRWVLVAGDSTVTALVVGQALPDGESDATMRSALMSVSIRAPLPLQDQIGALPFRITDVAGFRPVRVLGGNSVLLTDGEKDSFPQLEQPFVIVAEATQAIPGADQRDAFARSALFGNATLKDLAIERSEGFRQRGAEWHEIVARGTDIASGTPVVVSQTIRFGGGDLIRVLGVARLETRTDNLPRFRAVADGLAPD